MATIAGLRGTGEFGADERPKSFRETILFLNPNGEAPLTGLMSRMSSESVDDPEFSWWEETQGHVRLTVDGSQSDTADPITVTEGAKDLVKGDIIMVDQADGLGEIMEVTSTPSSDTSIDVSRGVAGSSAQSLSDGDNITKIGSAFQEGSNAPDSVTSNPTKLTNYCQIFKTTFEITNTVKETSFRTGDPKKNDRKRKMFDHSRDLEMAFMLGRPHEDTSGSQPKRYAGGLNHFINTHRQTFSGAGTLTEDAFIDAISPVFDYNGEGAGNERIVFAGNEALTAINKMARDSNSTRVNFDGTVKTFGMDLQRWVLPQGTIFIRTHPLLNVHGQFSKSMFVINPRGIKYRFLRDTNFKENIQSPDDDFEKGQWLTEAGIEVNHEKTMAYLGGVASENL